LDRPEELIPERHKQAATFDEEYEILEFIIM
jgi:hypothetical protein